MKKKPKNNAQPFGANSITMKEWQDMHPYGGRPYASDNYYLKIANKIRLILIEEKFVPAYTMEDVKYIALCLAAYFEDVVSELCIFRTFISEYRNYFVRDFPWYEIKEDYLDDEVNLVDVQYVMWQSMFARREGSIPNPENLGLLLASGKVYNLFLDEFEKAPVNVALVKDIYNEELNDNPGKLKTLLMWIGSSCYLFPVMSPVRKDINRDLEELHNVITEAKTLPGAAQYLNESYRAFAVTCGPLAKYPKDWYYSMCRQKDSYGCYFIPQMEFSPFYPFVIIKDLGEFFILCSCRGKEYWVDKKSFALPDVNNLRVGDLVTGMLFSYQGIWHICGLAYNTYIHDLKIAFDKLEEIADDLVDELGRKVDLVGKVDEDIPDNSPYGMAYDPLKCSRVIALNEGDRVFYFKNLNAAENWIHKNLIGKRKRKKTEDLIDPDMAVAVFITDDNRVIISSAADAIEDYKNPYYDPDTKGSLASLMLNHSELPNPMCKYLVSQHCLDRFALQSVQGQEHGRKLMRDNLRFFETLVRQYPFY